MRRESSTIIDAGETMQLRRNVILWQETCSCANFIVQDGVITPRCLSSVKQTLVRGEHVAAALIV